MKTISGVHVRLTKEQAAALAEIHKFSGISTYFVVNKEGKITYQKTSFPGVETLRVLFLVLSLKLDKGDIVVILVLL